MDHTDHGGSSGSSGSSSGSSSGPFTPDGGWNVYDSYTTDPYYQSLLLAGFAVLFGLSALLTLPSTISYIFINRRWSPSFFYERWASSSSSSSYSAITSAVSEKEKGKAPAYRSGRWSAGRESTGLKKSYTTFWSIIQAHLWKTTSLPRMRPGRRRRSYLSLSNGSILAILASTGIILATILPEQRLVNNANRLGFLALGILPIIFLLSMKAFSPIALFLGKSYEKVNFLHRWLGRMLLVLILAHSGLWINQWRTTSTSYAKEMLAQDKQKWGLLALAFLFVLAVSSIRPIRNFSYPTFFFLHILGFVGLIVGVNLHTPYAHNWAGYAVCAIYGMDLLGRICHWRMREVTLEPLIDNNGDSSGMTRITVHDLSGGWRAGQHIQLRLFYAATSETKNNKSRWLGIGGIGSTFRSFESHPFTIAQAPPEISILPAHQSGGFTLYARAVTSGKGSYATWSHELHEYARAASIQKRSSIVSTSMNNKQEQDEYLGVRSICTLEGPYGGPGYSQLDNNETVLLVACGSGMSYTIALLDEIVGRTLRGLRGARTRLVEVIWVVRHSSCLDWFSKTLDDLAAAAEESGLLSVNVKVYVTCTSYDKQQEAGGVPSCACNDFTLSNKNKISQDPSSSSSICRCAPNDIESGIACCCAAPSSSIINNKSTNTPKIQFNSPSITISYSRPNIPSILRNIIKSAINPCDSCLDCKCGIYSGDGTCGGANNGCGGGSGGGKCAMPPSADVDGGKRRRDLEGDEIQVLPQFGVGEYDEDLVEKGELELEKEKEKVGCCGSKKMANKQANCCSSKKPKAGGCCSSSNKPTPIQSSCCSSQPIPSRSNNCCSTSTSTSSSSCKCSSNLPPTTYPPSSSRLPAEIRTGGLGIGACGPSSMLAELRNSIVDIPLRKKVKIGGIDFVGEGFEL